MKQGDRVTVLPILTGGIITNVRHDDRGVPILTVTLDEPSMTADGYYIAREHEVFTDFQWKMFLLDGALTGKPKDAMRNTAQRTNVRTAEAWLNAGDIWYLADGGYSRIGFNWETRKIFLCSESRDEVRAAWERCAEYIAAAEAELNAYLTEQGI